MEKIKVNNQIVLMRKYVKQAKVRVINKLTKEVKLLQERKGNEVQVAKAKRKAERFLEEISLIKKIKPDYISKLALSKANNWNDVLKQKTSKLNDRCIAVLASYNAVQDEVDKFYSSNPTIVPKIPDLIKEWEVKSKLMKGLPKGEKMPEIKKRRMEMSMNKMNLKDKFNSASSVLDQQIGKKTDILLQNQKSLSNDEVDKEENDTSCQETKDDENTSVLENNDHKKHKKIRRQRPTRLNSVDQQNKISEDELSESRISDENSIKEESDESCNNDVSSSVSPPKELTGDSDKSEDSDSMSGETSHVENKVIQLDSRNEKFSFIKNVCSDFQEKKNKKQQASDDKNAYSSPVKSSCIQTSDLNLKKKSTGKNLKAITLINLNELDDLDEIPLDKSVKEDSEESEEEDYDDEDESKEHSEKLIDDPFFLGSDKVGNANDGIVNAKSRDLSSFSRYDHENERERDMSFNRKERSFPNNFNKRFQNSSNHSAFSKNESSRFNYSKNKPFKRDQFKSEYLNDRFQRKGKHFQRDAVPSSNRRERRDQMFGRSKKPQERQSDKLYVRNKSRDSFRKEKAAGIKSNDAGEKSLHPSWEAKKKLKEMAQTGFQGKRMVFS